MGGGGFSQATECRNIGEYLGARLCEIGIHQFFGVPGDFNMGLLDQLMKEPGLKMVGCCNELNAGYAADGYARASGIGCCVVTHLVGGLSVLNAIAGAYAEHHPVVCIIGIPNSNDLDGLQLIHHTLANTDTTDQTAAFRLFTCHQERIKSVERAAEQIDTALGKALRNRRPVLIEVASNLAGLTHASLAPAPVPYAPQPRQSNQRSLEAAVEAVAGLLNKAQCPALIGGPLLKPYSGEAAFRELAEAMGCPVAVQASAKGMFPETHDQFLGVYWGNISSPHCVKRLRAADVLLAAGALLNDMNTVGFTGPLPDERTVRVDPSRITISGGVTFGDVQLPDFLRALPAALARKWKPEPELSLTALSVSSSSASLQESSSSASLAGGAAADSAPYFGFAPAADPDAPLTANALYYRMQELLGENHEVVTDTGDSLFQVMKLRLPGGCGLQMQAQYASIGWSVGATLGLAAAHAAAGRRVVAIVGDGAFQMTAQEIATIMRQRLNPIFILVNNSSYAIEEMVHPGEYNALKVWDYNLLAQALSNGDGSTFTTKVKTEAQLCAALKEAGSSATNKFCFLDVTLAPNDCSRELIKFGAELGKYGSRPPRAA